jgi:hypothetical protein
LTREEFPDAVETACAVRSLKRVKIVDLPSFVQACKGSSSAERIGGLLVDMTTKSMVSQIWDAIQKHERGVELTEKLTTRFNDINNSHSKKVAILDVVDRFWKMAR